ncbi:heteromeric transposase endonuclease subunit TnsA [Pseudoduganella umbonata]|uniref:Heteromeric transposase endonuclease subunit TnsA n=1 Tax=Pseudoduganella umbonata TaxID=864828 RepID=A0ABX5UT04_9BURK|nr:heteromeric transposase endonuclease subunit TnsA [Pseudoduganella umbonata]
MRSNGRSLTGRLTVATGPGVAFESSLERDWLICLDFNPQVKLILEQPFTVTYETEGCTQRYTPDVLAQYDDVDGLTPIIVYEVKLLEDLRKSWSKYRKRFSAAVSFCRERDWRFKIVTEKHIRTPFLENAKFLRTYKRSPVQQLYRDQLLYSLKALGPATPQSLLAFSYLQFESKMAALPELWRMVATGELGAELSKPLTMSSPIWMPK